MLESKNRMIEIDKRGSDFFYKEIESLPQTQIIGHNIGLQWYRD